MSVDPFDALMAACDTPMSIITTAAGDERAGCLIGFQAQCSIDPRRYAVWLSKANHTTRVAVHADHLAVHFLDTSHQELAEFFGTASGDDTDKFSRRRWHPGPSGVPLLDECPNRMILERGALLDEGSDHYCFIGHPVDVTYSGAFTPLRFSDVAHLTAGHEVDERPRPPTERSV